MCRKVKHLIMPIVVLRFSLVKAKELCLANPSEPRFSVLVPMLPHEGARFLSVHGNVHREHLGLVQEYSEGNENRNLLGLR